MVHRGAQAPAGVHHRSDQRHIYPRRLSRTAEWPGYRPGGRQPGWLQPAMGLEPRWPSGERPVAGAAILEQRLTRDHLDRDRQRWKQSIHQHRGLCRRTALLACCEAISGLTK